MVGGAHLRSRRNGHMFLRLPRNIHLKGLIHACKWDGSCRVGTAHHRIIHGGRCPPYGLHARATCSPHVPFRHWPAQPAGGTGNEQRAPYLPVYACPCIISSPPWAVSQAASNLQSPPSPRSASPPFGAGTYASPAPPVRRRRSARALRRAPGSSSFVRLRHWWAVARPRRSCPTLRATNTPALKPRLTEHYCIERAAVQETSPTGHEASWFADSRIDTGSTHPSHSATACRRPARGSRVGMNSWPT